MAMQRMGKTALINKENTPIKDKLISNTVYLFLDWFALSVIGFFYWFLAGKLLLPEEYGIVSTSVNLALMLGSASLIGLHSTVWKLIPEYLAKRKNNRIISLIRFSLKFILLSNFIILIILFSLSPLLLPILKIPLSVMLITGAILFSYSIALQFRYIIYGFQDMRKLTITDFIGQLSKVIVTPLLILFGFKYFGPLIGFLFGQILTILLRIGSIPLKGPSVKLDGKFIMFTYALPAFITGIGWLVFTNGQYVLLTALKNPEVTGIYTVAMILTSFLVVIPTTLNSALLPITSQLSVEKDAKKRQSRLIGLVLRYSLLITLPLAMLLFLFSKAAILLFSRAEYLSASQFFPLLIFGSVIYGLGGIFLDNIYAIGKPKVTRNIIIIMTLVFLVLAFPLIHLFSALGSALAYTISATLLALMSYLYLRRNLKMALPLNVIVKLLVSVVISFGLLYITMIFVQDLITRILFAFISVLTYLILLIPLKFYTVTDIRILDFFANKQIIVNKLIGKLRDFLSKFAE